MALKPQTKSQAWFELMSNFLCEAHARNKSQNGKKTNYLIRAHFLGLFSSLLTRLLHLNKKSIQLFIIMFMSYIVFSCVRVHSMSAYICRHFSVPSCGQEKWERTQFRKIMFIWMHMRVFNSLCVLYIFCTWRVVPMRTIPIFLVSISYQILRIRKRVAE